MSAQRCLCAVSAAPHAAPAFGDSTSVWLFPGAGTTPSTEQQPGLHWAEKTTVKDHSSRERGMISPGAESKGFCLLDLDLTVPGSETRGEKLLYSGPGCQ